MGKRSGWSVKYTLTCDDDAGTGNPFADGFLNWWSSPQGQLSDEVRETVWTTLESADVDAKNRQIIWADGKRLSITESVQRIYADCGCPLELIETHLIGWLEMVFAPETYTQEQLDELDRLTEEWIEDHERQTDAK
jgi:hypothetical protein